MICGDETYDDSYWNKAGSKDGHKEKIRINEEKYMATIQQSLLAIVDGLNKVGEMLCNQAQEQQKVQEEFFAYQRQYFEFMKERDRQLGLEESKRR